MREETLALEGVVVFAVVTSALVSFFGRPRFRDGSGPVSTVADAAFFADGDLLVFEAAALGFVAPLAEAFAATGDFLVEAFAATGDFLVAALTARGDFFVAVRLATLPGEMFSSAASFLADCTAFLGERRNTVAAFLTVADVLPFLGVSDFAFAMTWEYI